MNWIPYFVIIYNKVRNDVVVQEAGSICNTVVNFLFSSSRADIVFDQISHNSLIDADKN